MISLHLNQKLITFLNVLESKELDNFKFQFNSRKNTVENLASRKENENHKKMLQEVKILYLFFVFIF